MKNPEIGCFVFCAVLRGTMITGLKDLNAEALQPPATIKKNFEEFGV